MRLEPSPQPSPRERGPKTSTSSTSPGHHGLSNYTSNQGKFTSTVLDLFSEILSPAYTIKMSSLNGRAPNTTSFIASPGLARVGELPVLSIRASTHRRSLPLRTPGESRPRYLQTGLA